MPTTYHRAQGLTRDADQAELESIINDFTAVDAGARDEKISGATHDHESTDEMDSAQMQKDDLRDDDFIGGIHEELARRVDYLGSAYPFSLEKNTLTYKKRENSLYEFLLLISVSVNITERNQDAVRLFERVSSKVVAAYFGAYAKGFHTGSPRDSGTTFKEKMQEIQEKTEEFVWGPEFGMQSRMPNDDGLDFVVCMESADKRKIGQMFVLGQCACGDDWKTKYHDLDIEKIKKWFHPMTTIPPVRAFSAPHHVVDGLLREASRSAGLFFDRARLTRTVANACKTVLDRDIWESVTTQTDELLADHMQ
ncbi:MAG: hypothetical protein MPK62_05290 [Alphaproteobacteria bacterium]|nr:hypothetical protein [Alphaproteobacteria bacterium]MDA8009742.1 hypothetical protein [Alphaproteobacteria bacterium]MDA8030537.1 hypothetical protein [Alphaproteobacteria bacterium]